MLIFVIKTTRPPSPSPQLAQRLRNSPGEWASTSWRKTRRHSWDLSTRRQTEITIFTTVVSCISSWWSQSVSYIDHCRGWSLDYLLLLWHYSYRWMDQEWEERTTDHTNIWLAVFWRWQVEWWWRHSPVYLQLNYWKLILYTLLSISIFLFFSSLIKYSNLI